MEGELNDVQYRPYRWMALAGIVFAFLPCHAQIDLSGMGEDPGEKLNTQQVGLLIDSLSAALQRIYIFPDHAGHMADDLRMQQRKKKYATAQNRRELARMLADDLQHVHPDGHLNVAYDPGLVAQLDLRRTDTEIHQDREQDIQAARQRNFAFVKTEVLPGNIGYIRWDGFAGQVAEAAPTVAAAFLFTGNTDALIIDLRYNGGGSPDMVLHMQDYFFAERTHMNDIIQGGRDTLVRYTDPKRTDFKLNMPVYILSSNYTFSAAEDFIMGLQHAQRAIIVGDTTGGGAHPRGAFNIGQGFVAIIPVARHPENVDWEGIGVRPDVPIASEEALAQARCSIFTRLLEQATEEQDRNRLQWHLNACRAELEPPPLPAALHAFAGVYEGGLDFYVQNGHLQCRNAERGGYITELKPMGPDMFILDENVQVRFEPDASGTYFSLKMLWINGDVSEKKRL